MIGTTLLYIPSEFLLRPFSHIDEVCWSMAKPRCIGRHGRRLRSVSGWRWPPFFDPFCQVTTAMVAVMVDDAHDVEDVHDFGLHGQAKEAGLFMIDMHA